MRTASKVFTHIHRGYCLQQSSCGWHYIIIDIAKDELVLHASCLKKLSEQEAREHIDSYIERKNEREKFEAICKEGEEE